MALFSSQTQITGCFFANRRGFILLSADASARRKSEKNVVEQAVCLRWGARETSKFCMLGHSRKYHKKETFCPLNLLVHPPQSREVHAGRDELGTAWTDSAVDAEPNARRPEYDVVFPICAGRSLPKGGLLLLERRGGMLRRE